MKNAVKRIGVLTSGGDAPGMNACIRAVVRSANARGIECVGIRRGYQGLISGDIVEMDNASVSRIINRGGTILYSARCDEFRTKEGQEKAYATCKLIGLDGLVAIGGDGTFRGAQDLSKFGVSVVGIPGTIDNDIVCTDYTIGFDTAANTAVECMDKLRDTMQSHERCSVVEVMGHRAGYLALYVGVAIGATAVLAAWPWASRSKRSWGWTPASRSLATSSGAAAPPPRTASPPPAWATRRCSCWRRARPTASSAPRATGSPTWTSTRAWP